MPKRRPRRREYRAFAFPLARRAYRPKEGARTAGARVETLPIYFAHTKGRLLLRTDSPVSMKIVGERVTFARSFLHE
jgi:hypothetical protein